MGLNSNAVQQVNNTYKFITTLTLHYQIWKKRKNKQTNPGHCHCQEQWSQAQLFLRTMYFILWRVMAETQPSLVAQTIKNLPIMWRDLGSIPGLERFPEGGHDNPLWYSCLENPHGQRNPVGYSPWGCRVDMTKWLSTAQHVAETQWKLNKGEWIDFSLTRMPGDYFTCGLQISWEKSVSSKLILA